MIVTGSSKNVVLSSKKPGTADLELSKGAAPQLPDDVDDDGDDDVSVDGCAEEEERWK